MRTRTATLAISLLCISIASAPLGSQTSRQKPSFEVASIKRNTALDGRVGGNCHASNSRMSPLPTPLGECVLNRVTVKMAIQIAYDLRLLPQQFDERIVGGPKWGNSDQFDIVGKADNPASVTDQQLHAMLQTLLSDRFGLKSHRETKDFPGYSLEVMPHGPKFKQIDGDPLAAPISIGDKGTLRFNRSGMEVFASFLSGRVGKPVINETGLQGIYDFTLSWKPDEDEILAGGAAIEQIAKLNPSGPSIYSALQEQLGLRLKPQKVPVSIFVIDDVRPPTEN